MPKYSQTKLTKAVVEAAKPDASTDYFIWDSALPGFGLRAYSSGRKVYLIKYRTQDKRQRKIKIGQHGALTVEQARSQARELLVDVGKGLDPAAVKQSLSATPTVSELAQEYLERHARPKKRPKSVKDDEAMLDHHILPKLGPMRVAAVGRADVEKLHNSLASTPYSANRVLALLSKMLGLAAAWGWRTDNPVKGIPRFHEDRRERWLSQEELDRLWAVLDASPNRRAANAVQLLILTGARRSEVLGATWEQMDLERGVWIKPSAHTKQKRTEHVPLSRPALALLSTMQAEADAGSTYLFPSSVPDKPLSDIKRFWASACRDAEIHNVRIHDLRHTYASHLVSSGESLHIVGKLLGHTQPQTTARYAHLADTALRDATEKFGAKLGPADNDK